MRTESRPNSDGTRLKVVQSRTWKRDQCNEVQKKRRVSTLPSYYAAWSVVQCGSSITLYAESERVTWCCDEANFKILAWKSFLWSNVRARSTLKVPRLIGYSDSSFVSDPDDGETRQAISSTLEKVRSRGVHKNRRQSHCLPVRLNTWHEQRLQRKLFGYKIYYMRSRVNHVKEWPFELITNPQLHWRETRSSMVGVNIYTRDIILYESV